MGGWSRVRDAWRVIQEKRAAYAEQERMGRQAFEREALARLLSIAEAALSPPVGRQRWLGVQLLPDEREILSLPNVALVEPTRGAERSRGGYAELGISTPLSLKIGTQRSRTTTVVEPTVIDTGHATITNQRVLFSGPKDTRVFDLHELVDVRIAEKEPLVYFHHRGRDSTTGLKFALRLREAVVDHLEVAIAISRGQGESFVDSLRAALQQGGTGTSPSLERSKAAKASSSGSAPWRSTTSRVLVDVGTGAVGTIRAAIASRPPRSSPIIAGLGRRAAARSVDTFVYLLLAMPATLPFTERGPTGETTVTGAGVIVWFATVLIIEAAVAAIAGGSIGKRLFGMTVVDDQTGGRVGVFRVVVRTTVTALLTVTVIGLVVELLVALFDPERKSLHDRAARTLVCVGQRQPEPVDVLGTESVGS